MTLALAQSFIDSKGKYNHALSIEYWTQWWARGRFCTHKNAWDVGKSTRRSLAIWNKRGVEDIESTQVAVDRNLNKDDFSGNGSLMRVSPVGVALFRDSDAARKVAREQSVPTHPSLACVEGCEAFTLLMCKAMNGRYIPLVIDPGSDVVLDETKEQICEAICNFTFTHPALLSRFAQYKKMDDFTSKSASDITSTGWVVDTLEVALWAFFKHNSWSDCVLAVVNLGGDADTAGAVCGGLCGVYYGIDAIPEKWKEGMKKIPLITEISEGFASLVSSWQGTGQ